MEQNDNLHIGQIIQAQLKADQRSVGWLTHQIPCSRNHVYKLFKRPSLDGDLLLRSAYFQRGSLAYLHLDIIKKSHPGTLLFSSRGENGQSKRTTLF